MDTCDKMRRARPLLGTFVEVSGAGLAPRDLDEAVDAAFDDVAQVHRLMSFHDPESDISRLNREASLRAVPVHPWTYQVLEAAVDLHRHSAGVFDLTIAPLLQELRLLPGGTNDPAPADIGGPAEDTIELLPDFCVRYRRPRTTIDVGGIAKGFAVDRAIEVLRGRGVARGCVNAGGDLAAFGAQPELILIRNPRDPSRVLCEIEIANAALASSGSPFNLLHSMDTMGSAIIDPMTREQVHDSAGATVRASNCMIADALTKIVMIAGDRASELLQRHQASALRILSSGEIRVTPDWHHAVRHAA